MPMRYAALEVGDILDLVDGAIRYRVRVQQVQMGKPGMLGITAVMDASEAWDGYIAPSVGGDGASVSPIAETRMELLDIPALPTDTPDALTVRVAMCGASPSWNGASLLRVSGTGEDAILTTISTAATMGNCATLLASGTCTRFDRVNTVDLIHCCVDGLALRHLSAHMRPVNGLCCWMKPWCR
ncbi:MAG: hypothetical protein B7X02_00900 [Rhodospirillales bacterium 12-54-5]|nr:MAG: hypothetical protein B7X02_00900 [Rhodospirillales bacterium 12-54-5]